MKSSSTAMARNRRTWCGCRSTARRRPFSSCTEIFRGADFIAGSFRVILVWTSRFTRSRRWNFVNPLEDRPGIEEMAAAHVRTIRSVRPHGPYVIGGFCLGGLIGYEVAQQLVAQGETVERLLVIDARPRNVRLRRLRRAAEWQGRKRGYDSNRQLYFFCRWFYRLARVDRLRNLTFRQRWADALEPAARTLCKRQCRNAGPTPDVEDSPTAWFDPRLDVPLVFLWATGGYEAKSYAGHMTLLLSSDLIDGSEGRNPVRAWRRLVPRLQTETLAGRHLECITQHVGGLAGTIRRCLE